MPPDWRVVDDSGVDSFGRALPAPGTRTLELWRLTLEAQNIPHLVVGHGANQRIFVPALREGAARAELGFTPASAAAYARAPVQGDDHLFVLAGGANIFAKDRVMLPLLSHA